MPEHLKPEVFEALVAHHRRTWRWFIALWIYTPLMMLAVGLLELPAMLEAVLIAIMFVWALVAVVLQFRARCPGCGANLGLQVRLGIPEICARCGQRLRVSVPRHTGDGKRA